MKPSIKKKFLDLKINLINQQKSDKVTIIANRNSLDPVLRVIWCASIFNKYKKHNIILFSSKKFEFFNKIFQAKILYLFIIGYPEILRIHLVLKLKK